MSKLSISTTWLKIFLFFILHYKIILSYYYYFFFKYKVTKITTVLNCIIKGLIHHGNKEHEEIINTKLLEYVQGIDDAFLLRV